MYVPLQSKACDEVTTKNGQIDAISRFVPALEAGMESQNVVLRPTGRHRTLQEATNFPIIGRRINCSKLTCNSENHLISVYSLFLSNDSPGSSRRCCSWSHCSNMLYLDCVLCACSAGLKVQITFMFTHHMYYLCIINSITVLVL